MLATNVKLTQPEEKKGMASYLVTGGVPLCGRVRISGSKNAALGIIAAAMVVDGPSRIENLPHVSDINTLLTICRNIGAEVEWIDSTTVRINPQTINTYHATDEQVRSLRGSYYLLGALLGRFGKVCLALPGGCDFGSRPIDQHLKGFEALGATAEETQCEVSLKAERLTGSNVFLDIVSVGATINIMLAAVKAQGVTVIDNAAKEPHIVDVANFLNAMGVNVRARGRMSFVFQDVPYCRGDAVTPLFPIRLRPAHT